MTSPAGRKDLELVQRAVSEHHAFVYRLAYRMLRNQADAEDLTQTVFVELVRSPGALARVASPKAWLARVTFSKAASIKRCESRRRRREETWAKDRPQKADGDEMNANDEVSEAIASLPDELRVPVVLHYQEGLKYREIAEVCQCAEGTIASRISTAKEKLREKLKHGGALAGFGSMEAALEAEGAVPMPAGLEARLLEGVAREFALVGGAAGPSTGATGSRFGSFTGGTAFTVGTAFVLAGALMTGGWLGIRGALERDQKRPDAIASASTQERASGKDAVEGREGERHSSRARRRGKAASAGPQSGEAPAAADGEATPADGARKDPIVLGWVRDHRGKPLEGVTVGIVPPGSDSPARTTTTDEEGYYEFEDVSPAQQELLALYTQKADLDDAARSAMIALDQAKMAEALATQQAMQDRTMRELEAIAIQEKRKHEVRDNLEQALRSYKYRVTAPPTPKPSACPEPNAAGLCTSCHPDKTDWVAELEYTEYSRAVAVTNQEVLVKTGFLALGEKIEFTHAMQPQYTVVAQLDGFRVEASEPFELKDGESVQVELTLEGTMAITGSVLGADGSPIPEADVTVVGHAGDRLLPATATKTRTDAGGLFTLASLPAGVYAIRASAAGFEPVEAIASTGGQARFDLPFTGSARVTVARSETGEPLSGFRVDLRQGRWVVAQGVTGDDGVAQLADVPPGDYIVNTYREGSTSRQSRARDQLVVNARRESTIRLEVTEKVKVAGHVSLREPAATLAGLSVKATRLDDSGEVDASPKTVESAEDGSFRWSGGLAPGDYVVELHSGPQGTGAVIGSMDLVVMAGQEIEDLEVAEGAARQEGRATRREAAAKKPPAATDSLEPATGDDRTVTIQEPMKLRTFLALAGASGAGAVAPSSEVEASGVLDHARVETTGTSGFQTLLRGSLEPEGLRCAPSGDRFVIETGPAG